MFRFMIICYVWFLHTVLISCSGNSTVIQLSVPEDHHICLQCGGTDSSDVVWTHRERMVLVTRQGSYETNANRQRYHLTADGGLCLLRLDDSDGGKFHCNQELVAELQVLIGQDFMVFAGRTLLLPCSGSSKPKKKWSRRREGGRWEAILTFFRNGTVKPEVSRISFGNDALQIQNLQLEDAGEYLCNGELQARITVLADVVEIEKKKRRPDNALLMVAVVGLGLLILLMAAVCVLLTSMKCRRITKHRCTAQRPEDTEMQPWRTNLQTEQAVYESPCLPEEMIHYASLGRQNWKERPSRTPPDQNHHNVIYSSVITRPAAQQKRTLLHPLASL